MLKRHTWMLMMLLIALVAFTGCSDDDDPVTPTPTNNFSAVANAVGTILNDNTVTPGVISATDLFNAQQNKVPMYTVLDVRGETDYGNGHIPGAINTSLGSLIADLGSGKIPTDKPFAVACYTGQAAGHAKIALEMLGYEAKSLLWGMSSWSPNVTGTKWSEVEKCKSLLANPETTNNNGDLVAQDYPNYTETLETRVAGMLANGFQGIGYDTIKEDLGSYFIMNYWGEADYLGTGTYGTTGHIPGAYQFTPYSSLHMDGMLNNLPTDKTIVVYCWTGQHSSQVTAALNTMGYTAKSLTYGANQLMWSNLTGHKWSDTNVKDYALE
jgi:rhodanese-related sulfurtransferase